MEVKWDIYLYDDKLYFCRSWSGEMLYRATTKCEPPILHVVLAETANRAMRSHAAPCGFSDQECMRLQAKALHPLPENLGRNPEQLARHSFWAYGSNRASDGTQETIAHRITTIK